MSKVLTREEAYKYLGSEEAVELGCKVGETAQTFTEQIIAEIDRKLVMDDIIKKFKIRPSIFGKIVGSYSRNEKREEEFIEGCLLPWLEKNNWINTKGDL